MYMDNMLIKVNYIGRGLYMNINFYYFKKTTRFCDMEVGASIKGQFLVRDH